MEERTVTFEIDKQIGVIATHDSGWKKELNIVAWNGQKPKFDIRDWNEKHDRMGKGITLLDTEMKRVVELYMEQQDSK